jgi:transposase
MKRAGGSTGMQKAAQLIAQAKHSVGDTIALDEAKQDLGRLIQEYERIVELLDRIEQDIQVLLSEIPMADHLRSIGLGSICIAAILSVLATLDSIPMDANYCVEQA